MAIASPSVREASPRVVALYDRLMQAAHIYRPLWGNDLTVLDDSEVAAQPLIVRKAKAVELVLTTMPISIDEDELIVGKVLSEGPAYGKAIPNYATDEERRAAAARGQSIYSVFGHSAPGHGRVLGRGMAGIVTDCQRRLAEVRTEPHGPQRAKKEAALEAFVISCQAVVKMANRYAALAEAMAQTAAPGRAAELREIASVCLRVPEHPAASFQEAVQAFWFTHAAMHSTIGRCPIGRLDQFLWPYYQRDVQAGRLTRARAQELMDCLWMNFAQRTMIDREAVESALDKDAMDRKAAVKQQQLGLGREPWVRLKSRDWIDAVNHWLQNVMIGGQTPDGRDATNDLTYICLDSQDRLQLTNPVLNLRIHAGTPPELLRRVAEVLRAGGGAPAIFNDQALVPALVRMGYPIEHARDYCNDGCWEVILPGRSEFRFSRVGLLKALEWTLNRGRSLLTGEAEAPDVGDPAACRSFDEFFALYEKQLRVAVTETVDSVTQHYGSAGEIAPDPLMSATVEGCIEKAKDYSQGGATYTTFGIVGDGASYTIDSLAAIKRSVYDEGRLSMAELVETLRNNFAGQEALRQYLQSRTPKFGNDDDHADGLAVRLVDSFSGVVQELAAPHPWIKFPVAVGTFSWVLAIGGGCGASADGRPAESPVSSNFSPSIGADSHGPMADIRSYCKVDQTKLALGAPLDLKVAAGMFQGEAGLQRLMALIQSFGDLKGNILTVTVSDASTLRAAQREPEKYRNLRVRMGGWSAYFVTLSRENQEYHIARVQSGQA